jgi:sodium-dependent dicarboxylate transporter 2/3/5
MLKKIGLFSGPLLFILIALTGVSGLEDKAVWVIAIGAWMIVWWSTEAVNISVTALLPPVLFPLTGVFEIKQALAPYSSPIVFLFMGGFMLAVAMQKWNLHERISLHILKRFNANAFVLVLGFGMATALMSMWISNTAAALMMMPIAVSIIQKIGKPAEGNFSRALLLVIAYSASIGGAATIIGTPPNVAFAGLYAGRYGTSISFANWLIVGIPFSMLLLLAMVYILGKWVYPLKGIQTKTAEGIIDGRLHELGKIKGGERMTVCIFLFTVSCWVLKDFIISITGLTGISDSLISIAGGILLFTVPIHLKSRETPLNWEDTKEIPWGILLLFGGGLSLAAGMESTGIVSRLGTWVASNGTSSVFLLSLSLALTALFATELMSNVALVNVFIPVVFGIADAAKVSPVLLGIPVALAASCAFMFPISTPPNAVIFGSGKIKIGQMMRAGILVNITAIVIIQCVVHPLIKMFLL